MWTLQTLDPRIHCLSSKPLPVWSEVRILDPSGSGDPWDVGSWSEVRSLSGLGFLRHGVSRICPSVGPLALRAYVRTHHIRARPAVWVWRPFKWVNPRSHPWIRGVSIWVEVRIRGHEILGSEVLGPGSDPIRMGPGSMDPVVDGMRS